MIDYLDPGRDADDRVALQEEIIELGLAHRLVTQWTSFVAVARPVVNPGGDGVQTGVAVPQVEGVSAAAYPPSALPKTSIGPNAAPPPIAPTLTAEFGAGSFTGSSAPEPESWLALAALAVAGSVWLRRRDRWTRA
jgi:hypothetical protein